MDKSQKLDNIDLLILKAYQENGKLTNIALSQLVGLSAAPTLERVKKLETIGYLKSCHAVVDLKKVHLELKALIQITLERQKKDAAEIFEQKMNQIPEVMEVFQVTGRFDFYVKVLTKNISSFEQLIREKFAVIEEIGNMETMIVLRKLKDNKVVPLSYPKQ